MKPTRPKFNTDDARRASDAWGANCGPSAIAAICGLTLDEVRPFLGDFESRHYTNPGMMADALSSLVDAKKIQCCKITGTGTSKLAWPQYGLARIQWEGPWTAPGVPIRVRYRQTHWVGACSLDCGDVGIFDINCIHNGSGWTTLEAWRDVLVPWLLKECVPRADGNWHITHAIEVKL